MDITYCNLTSFLYYKDIIWKAFFTMATLLMLLLENGVLVDLMTPEEHLQINRPLPWPGRGC